MSGQNRFHSAPANIAEGASRDSKKEYLLYIARGSLSEAQYFIHLALRLGYHSDDELLTELTKRTFACLHGLIRSVEKEAGKITKIVASVTSFFVLSPVRFASGPIVRSPLPPP